MGVIDEDRLTDRLHPLGGCGVSTFATELTTMRMEQLKSREIAQSGASRGYAANDWKPVHLHRANTKNQRLYNTGSSENLPSRVSCGRFRRFDIYAFYGHNRILPK